MNRCIWKALTVFYLYHSQVSSWAETFLSMRGEIRTGSPLFHVFHVVIRSLLDTTVWDAILHKYTDLQSPLSCSLLLFMLSFWHLSAEQGAVRAITVHIDFRRTLCTVTSSPESETLICGSIITLDLQCGLQKQGEDPFSLPPRRCNDAIFDTSFAYTQHDACISVNLEQVNAQTKSAQEEKARSFQTCV